MKRMMLAIIIFVIILGAVGVDSAGMTGGSPVGKPKAAIIREPAVAGALSFYPSDSTELRTLVRSHLDAVTDLPKVDGRIIALIVPHAGLIYSGPIAAYSYKLLDKSSINKVILCGPSHRYAFDGISVYGANVQWRTPFGLVSCDDRLCTKMTEGRPGIDRIEAAHKQEHSLEVQLPYLQTILKNVTIVPVVMGSQNAGTIRLLADALSSVPFDDSTIMIAATDWQHYMPAKDGAKSDSAGIDCLKKLDFERLEKYLQTEKTQMCGGGPTAAVIRAAITKGADKAVILKYGDSGDITGDKSSVVSYVAAVLYKSNKPGKATVASIKKDSLPALMELTAEDKQQLLFIARHAIENYLKTGTVPQIGGGANLKRPGAAFVTLEKNRLLRGCIGQTAAVAPLHETVARCAVQAAVDDPRFNPVELSELPDIHIEISVLTPLQKVTALDQIIVGRDGLVIAREHNRGLLLPQVATELGWDRTTFLEETCRKAGLPSSAYKDSRTEIFKFQAIIFGEGE